MSHEICQNQTIQIIPEHAFTASYLERITRHAPAFTMTIDQNIYRFFFDGPMAPASFSKVITCEVAEITMDLIVSPSLWNSLFQNFLDEQTELETLPPMLAQAVVDAAIKALMNRFSHFLGQPIRVKKIHQTIPSLEDHEELCLRVTAGINEGQIAIRFAHKDLKTVEQCLDEIWHQVHPLFHKRDHVLSLEQAHAYLSIPDYQALEIGDVLFVESPIHEPDHGFMIRLNQQQWFAGEIQDDIATITSQMAPPNLDQSIDPDHTLRLSVERCSQQLKIGDQSEIKPGFRFSLSQPSSPLVNIRLEGALCAKGCLTTIGERRAVIIEQLGPDTLVDEPQGNCHDRSADPDPVYAENDQLDPL